VLTWDEQESDEIEELKKKLKQAEVCDVYVYVCVYVRSRS